MQVCIQLKIAPSSVFAGQIYLEPFPSLIRIFLGFHTHLNYFWTQLHNLSQQPLTNYIDGLAGVGCADDSCEFSFLV